MWVSNRFYEEVCGVFSTKEDFGFYNWLSGLRKHLWLYVNYRG